MYPFYWTSSERGTYQLSGRFLVPEAGTNDNILRIKKTLKETEKTYKYTRKEKYNIMKNLIGELDLEEQKLLKFELERDIETLKRGLLVKDLIVAGFSGVSLLLSAISLVVKSIEKYNGNLLNIVWIVCIIDALYFVRLSILPFLYSFNCDIQLFEGKEYVSSYINKSCILMLFEFLAIQITIYLHSHRKNNDKIKVKYINIKENISKFLIIGLSAYIIIVYCFMPQYAESFKTILNLSDADFTIAGDSIVYQIGTIGRIIKTLFSMSFQIIRILLPAYIIRSVCKKNASPKLAFAVLIVFCLLQFFFLTSTFAEAIVACLAIILYYLHLFPSKKKKIIMLIGISTIGIMIVYFAVRYFSKNSSIYDKSSGPILYMAQIISAYFTGPDNVAAIFNVDKSFGKEAFKAGIIGAIPFNSTLFGDRGNKLQYYYNIYNRAYGQIPPTIGAGYYYFGFILAPIISILFVKLSLVYYDKAQKINKSIKYISEIFCSITFALGTVMYSPSITLAWFFSWGIPMLILTSFTGEK